MKYFLNTLLIAACLARGIVAAPIANRPMARLEKGKHPCHLEVILDLFYREQSNVDIKPRSSTSREATVAVWHGDCRYSNNLHEATFGSVGQ